MKAIIRPNDCSDTTIQTQMATLLQMNWQVAPPRDSSKHSSMRQGYFWVNEFTYKGRI